jgi:hypothetical protein
VDPQVIAPIKIDEAQALNQLRAWLKSGWLAPDDLAAAHRRLSLRPAYYSCWTFDGSLEVRWSCEVQEDMGVVKRWAPRNGVEAVLFDDVLVPGLKSLSAQELASVEPFDLKALKPFEPDYLAGWPTMIYDRSLSEASLLAREKVLKRFRRELMGRIEMGQEKRNLTTSGGEWSGMTFKHVLLPLWVGAYHYAGREYHFLVNGQSGKVGGGKPRDRVKVWMMMVTAAIALGLIGWLVVNLLQNF